MAARALSVAVYAKIDRFKKGMKGARAALSRFADSVGAMSVKVAKIGVGMAVGAVGAGAALVAYTSKVADVGAELDRLSKRSGLSVETLEALKRVAGETGGEFDDLNEAYKTYIERFVEAGEGNKTFIEDFKRMGIEIRDVNGALKDAEATFFEMAERMRTADDAGKMLAATEILLATDGTKMIDMLTGLDESLKDVVDRYKETGFWNKELAEAAREYKKEMSGVRRIIDGVAITIGLELLPHIKKAVTATKEWMEANSGLVKSKIKDWAIGLRDAITWAWNAVKLWQQNKGLQIWFARARSAVLFFKAIFVSAWNGIKIAGDVTLGTMALGIGKYVEFVGDKFAWIQRQNAAVLDSLAEAAGYISGEAQEGLMSMAQSARSAAAEMERISGRDNVLLSFAEKRFAAANESIDNMTEAWGDYDKSIEEVAYLLQGTNTILNPVGAKKVENSIANIAKSAERIAESFAKIPSALDFEGLFREEDIKALGRKAGIDFGDSLLGTLEGDLLIGRGSAEIEKMQKEIEPAKIVEVAIGSFGTITQSLMSLTGMRQMQKKTQRVEDPQLQETNAILSDIQAQGTQPARMGA